ncbi:Flagellar biosynthetic protein FliQ [Aquicella siphonis]|uniref:Flagellar biosynthetic protein FliQ n=1 Tax=Aquicella siphonis TaxID=254247 RepID=A0A5E4PLH5_9COXI|nr:flagellar biosynthetic protein FliQ [Aquicella siphonis]VVC77112.1 Flagellar biosynthetic protein FliQ [Aquicella siphonis]
MNDLHMLNAMQQMLYYTMIAVCIITIPTLIVGLIVSIIQAATQINEMTMTFIPKMLVMFTLLFILSPWLMHQLVLIMRQFLTNLPAYIR